MSNLESITEKILAEARVEAGALQEQAREVRAAIFKDYEVRAEKEADQILSAARREAAGKKDRVLSSARIKARDKVLRAKQEVLERIFQSAEAGLSSMSDEEFLTFIENRLKDHDLEGKTLIVPASRLEAVLKSGLKAEGQETLKQGFLVSDGLVTLNFTFRELLEEARSTMEGDILSSLFGGE